MFVEGIRVTVDKLDENIDVLNLSDKFTEFVCVGNIKGVTELCNSRQFIKNRLFNSQFQFICLGFNSKICGIDDMIKYCNTLSVTPNMCIRLSQSNINNFDYCLVWWFDELIGAKEMKALSLEYSMFFRSKQPYIIESVNDWVFCLKYGTFDALRETEYSKCELGVIAFYNKLLTNTPTQIKRSGKKNFAKDYVENIDLQPEVETKCITTNWIDILYYYCDLWKRFVNNEELDNNELLCLFINLKFINYSHHGRYVKDDVKKIIKSQQRDNVELLFDFVDTVFRIKTSAVRPIPIVNYNGEDVTVADLFSNRVFQFQNNVHKISLEELDSYVKTSIKTILSRKSDKSSYVCCQTASGKTQSIIEWLIEQEDLLGESPKSRVVYCLPTYSLIDEVMERIKQEYSSRGGNPDSLKIYSVPKAGYIPSQDEDRMYLGLPPTTFDTERSNAIRQLINPNVKGIFIITHNLFACLSDIKADTIIIDENIEDALLVNVKIPLSKLSSLSLFTNSEDANKITEFCRECRNLENGSEVDISMLQEILNLDNGRFNIDDYIKSDKQTQIPNLFKTLEADKMFVYTRAGEKFIYRTLVSDSLAGAIHGRQNVKIFTATPNLAKLFLLNENITKDNLEYIELDMAENKGNVIQYVGMTGSKGADNCNIPDLLKQSKYCIEEILHKKIDDYYCITFKDAVEQAREFGYKIPVNSEGEPIHFGNNAGLDSLKGCDVVVLGKFSLPSDYYICLFYEFVGNKNMSKEEVEECLKMGKYSINNFGVPIDIFTFKDERLNGIQLNDVRTNSIQACGRARALREVNANVVLFSDVVLPDVDCIYLENKCIE